MFSATASTRKLASTTRSWEAEATKGQLGAVDFLKSQHAALLVADRGAGKTAIDLLAFTELQAAGIAQKMLVVAPLRVCQLVWRQEAAKWSEFQHLRFSLLHGPKKKERLRDNADISLINPEGCQWLADQYWGKALPWDTVTIDQTIRFKEAGGKRAKSLRGRMSRVRRKWGLEGALIPNGYLDLFGQFMMLDDGAALGKFISHYREAYFTKSFDGFNYDLMPGSAQRIEKRIQPYVFRLPYSEKPPLQDDIIQVELSPAERKLYNQMKKTMIVQLEGAKVTAANSAAVYGKLKQLANGAIYTGNAKEWVHVHDTKLDALEELIDELHGKPLLIGYEFRHDLQRILARFPNMRTFDGLNEKQAIQLQDDWNANKIPYMAAHPAQIGHGLNLQQGGACDVCWFSATIDLNLYEEFIGRLVRRGNTASRVNNHIIVANDTIDDILTLPALREKALTQNTLHRRLETALGNDIRRDADNPGHGDVATKETSPMVSKLSRQGGAAPAPAPANTGKPVVMERVEGGKIVPAKWAGRTGQPAAETGEAAPAPKPFGARPSTGDANPAPLAEQRAAITRRITPAQTEEPTQDETGDAPPNVQARKAFSPAVQQQLEETEGQDPQAADAQNATPPKATRTRRKADEPKAEIGVAVDTAFDYPGKHLREVALHAAIDYKSKIPHDIDSDDVLTCAAAFLDFLENGASAG